MVTTLRLVKKKKDKSERNGAKKRPRAGSIGASSTSADAAAAASNDPLERLATFRERMFDMKHDEKLSHSYALSTNPEDVVVLAKLKKSKDGSASSSKKKRKTMSIGGFGDNDDEAMPRVGVKKALSLTTKKKGEKKTSKSDSSSSSSFASATAVTVKSSTVKIPGGAANPVKKSAFGGEGKQHSSSISAQTTMQVGGNFQKWQRQQNSKVSSSTTVSSVKPKKKQIGASAASSSTPLGATAFESADSRSVLPTAVVTQDQLAMFENVLSLEDPLERAMQAVKEKMAESSSSSKRDKKEKMKEKSKTKEEEKIKKTKEKKEEKMEIDEEEEPTKKVSKKEKKAKVHETNSTDEHVSAKEETQQSTQVAEHAKDPAHAASGSEVSPLATAAATTKKKKKKRKNRKAEEALSSVQVDQFDAKQSEQAPPLEPKAADTLTTKVTKRKREDEQQEGVETMTSSSTTMDVEKVKAGAIVDASSPKSTGDVVNAAGPSAGLTAAQKKREKKKKREMNKKAQGKASISEADTASVPDTTAPAVPSLPLPSVAVPPSKSKVVSNTTPLIEADEEDKQALNTKENVKSSDARPTAQQQQKKEEEATPAVSSDLKKLSTNSSAKLVAVPNGKRQKVEKSVPKPTRPVSHVGDTKKKKSVTTISTNHLQPLDLTSNEMDSDKSGNELDHDEASESEDEFSDTSGSESTPSSQKQIFSNLIDEAARQQWDLLEVGRLVRLFAGQWGHKKQKTARFLRKFCPELVNVDFLEGLGVSLGPENLVKIFARGSGNAVVLMNKLASAIENGDLNVRDSAFLNVVAKRVRAMATNHEVLEFLVPLLESLSTVRDVSQLLKHICQHWHVDRTASLVQQILLTAVFDDLDGNQDEILKDLPQLRKKLDFPSRLDQEDADENGNLKGLIANEDSDLGEESGGGSDYEAAEDALGEIHSEDEDHEDDDEDEDGESYEGETDSEEEREALRAHQQQQRPTRRSRFILDEADEDTDFDEDDDEEEELETEDEGEHRFGGAAARGRIGRARGNGGDDSSSSSDSDSEDETWRSKPKSS